MARRPDQTARNEHERAARQQAARRRQRRKRAFITTAVSLPIAALVTFVVLQPEPVALANVETFPDLGQEHIDPAAPLPAYNSVPPTSGPHAPTPAPCGIYRQPVPDIFSVHSLEHGAIVIQYPVGTDSTTTDALESFARDAGTHVIVAPREDQQGEIAATAWTRKLVIPPDLNGLAEFYARYAQNGPERGVPCPLEVDETNT